MPISITSTNPLQSKVDSLDEATTQQDSKADSKPKVDPKVKKRNDEFRQRADICKIYRRKLIANWTVSIDYRRGKPFSSQTDEDQIAVNLDWTYTKAKQAALFSQVPKARLDHSPDTLPKNAPWVSTYERLLNDKLVEGGIEAVMDECLPDCINAAGIGVAMVSYESLSEEKDVPSVDMATLHPSLHAEALKSGTIGGKPIPMTTVPSSLDQRYVIQRISPADLLWPINFTGSNFNRAPWIGRSGRITWADAVQKWGLKEEDKETILGEDRPMMDKLTHDVEKDKSQADEMVSFDEMFYWEFQYDPDAQSFGAIHHLVYVSGKDDPVVDEPWKGQKIDDSDEKLIGATRLPIQVLTLSYLTDETIPPSDSAISRPQTNEVNKGRTQQIQQRQRSLPVRWFDVNRVDPAISQGLMRGTWQHMIPTQGDGTRIIGEVARAAMPPENATFDKIAKTDAQQQWGIGQEYDNEEDDGKKDVNQNKSPFNTALGRERAKVGSFFCALAEILGGLMCLYEDPQTLGEGFDPKFSRQLKFSILTDSTVLLDASQKLSRLNQFMNTYGKSGWVDLEPVLSEIATLVGLDPTIVVKAPQPKPPVEPNISLRLTGVEDMLNPLTLAMMIKSGQAPSADLIEQAKQLIQQAVTPPPGMDMPSSVQPQGGLPMLPGGAQPPTPPGGTPQGAPLAPNSPAPPPGSPQPSPPPPAVGEAHPQMAAMPKINQRSESGGNQ